MTPSLGSLEQAGVLSPLDTELAETLCRIAGEESPVVMLAVALTRRALGAGHACLDLKALASQPLCAEDQAEPGQFRAPNLAELLPALARSPLLRPSPPWELAPLLLDADNKLYFARMHDHESEVASQLRRIALRTLAPPAGDAALLDALFPPQSSVAEPDLQRAAAEASRARALSVIVGGPGTGKTSTVVKLLALLIHDAHARAEPAPRILLVAPTGKAAQRLSESIGKARDGLPLPPQIRAEIPSETSTIHRALGTLPEGPQRFQHGPTLPLPCDVLLIDEASMIDLALMRHLLSAVPLHARVIRLGDADQLASVEAGSVLDDICRADVARSPLAGCVSRLLRSYRYDPRSGIAQVARAIHEGDYQKLCAVRDRRLPDATISHEVQGALGAPRGLLRLATRAYAGLTRARVEDKLAALDGFRVLTAHRRGKASTELLNPLIARAVFGGRAALAQSYAGRPIMIATNDYATGLYNGDVGVLYREPRDGSVLACFRADDRSLRRLSSARLPAHESVYAMTIHKSQGSEFEHVAVVLPEQPSPLLSRELLYTAVTRARKSVAIFASEASLQACLAAKLRRASGLTARLISELT
jgi:exodeoxyribonuclease V alpha subunit